LNEASKRKTSETRDGSKVTIEIGLTMILKCDAKGVSSRRLEFAKDQRTATNDEQKTRRRRRARIACES